MFAELFFAVRFVHPVEQTLAALQLRSAAKALLADEGSTETGHAGPGQQHGAGPAAQSSAGEANAEAPAGEELRICVEGCHGLPGLPSAFVAYRLPDQPDTFTPTVPRCASPHFGAASRHAAPAGRLQLQQMALDVFVFDDEDPDSNYIGLVTLCL